MDIQKKLSFLCLYRMVTADGVIKPEEMALLYELGRDSYGLTDAMINTLIMENSTLSPTLADNKQKITFLYQMARMAWADNDIDPSEVELLENTARDMGIVEDSRSTVVNFLIDCAKGNKSEEEVMANFN